MALYLNTPFINYFHYNTGDEVGQLLDSGTIDFFSAADHTVRLATYADYQGMQVNTNPIVLGEQGNWPPIYMQDELYFIVIKDKYGNLVEQIDNYDPAQGGVTPPPPAGSAADNLFANGQFTYALDFSQTTTPGLVNQDTTPVAMGWNFLQNPGTTTKNVVTFQSVVDTSIEANPLQQIVLNSTNIQAAESLKDFRQIVGGVQLYQGEAVSFAFQMINLLTSGQTQVEVILDKYYGNGGSTQEFISMHTFQVGSTRQKYSFTFTLPTNAGKTIGEGHYIAIHLRCGLGQITNIGITNALGLVGTFSNPIYPDVPDIVVKSKILGQAYEIGADDGSAPLGLYQNYDPYTFFNGQFYPYEKTGTMVIETIGKEKADQLPCDGSTYKVSDYQIPSVPNRRLYNVIGNTYGGAGDLIVTSQNNVVTFASATGARQKTAYTAGNLGASVTVTNTVIGLRFGVNFTLTSPNVITGTFLDKFAPAQGAAVAFHPAPNVIRSWTDTINPPTKIQAATTSAGSPTTFAAGTLTFSSNTITDYGTYINNPSPSISLGDSFIEFCSIANPSLVGNYLSSTSTGRPSPPSSPMCIKISVDGKINDALPNGGIVGTEQTAIVPFLSSNSLAQNLQVFLNTVNNPFQWTVTFNAAPTASKYFTFSSDTVDYYAWYKVDGVGTDPAPGGTGVEVDISSGDSTTVIAQKTAAACNSLEFSVPAAADLPTIPSGGIGKLGWYIYV